MNTDQFWEIIDEVHHQSGGSMPRKCELLRARLTLLPPDELGSFVEHFDRADALAYTHPVWGAIFTLNGGCSDDSFDDFRATLISMGRAVFERTLSEPDSLAEVGLPEDPCFEGYQYVPSEVSKRVLGTRRMKVEFPLRPSGQEWSEEQLPALYPRLKELNRRRREEYRARHGLPT